MAMMMISGKILKFTGAMALAVTLLAGCRSKEDAAIDAAKKQAAATGQAQQVVSVDKSGNTTTVTVQPPAPGQTAQATTTTVTPAAAPIMNESEASVPSGQPAIAGQNGGAAEPAATAPPPVATPGGAPVIQPADVNVPAGTNLTIRINQRISVKTSRAGDRFDGEIVEPVVGDNGNVIIPKGAPVGGIVEVSHRRGHFKGASILDLRLTSLTLNGNQYRLDTRDLRRGKKGKGKRSAAFIGGGAGLGMLVGGVATGGVGLLVGGLTGAGAGTAVAGLTGNRDIEIPSESIVHFRLANDLVVQP
ncbi:MAG TPA: hypothetical protein VMU57_09725 [Edaphobacter sp.]|uniref:hypothetical protein n=1 Tax=Edaphobacter sp. TaxID=1934404 RepID=UPI002C55129C|nr:hypothetical protein [Edaphobacter sp.]HUZ95178.1 hypothetical protein [Edaphobacter sp.]